MKLVKKILLKPTKSQKETFEFWYRRTKKLYNVALEHKIEYYKITGKSISCFDQKKELVGIKEDDITWRDIPNKSLSEMVLRLDKSFMAFFKRGYKGFPKFKSENNCLYFDKTDVRVKDGLLFLPKIKVDVPYVGEIPSVYSSCRLIREKNKYYATFVYDYEVQKVEDNKEILGVDLGLMSLSTDSNGHKQKRFSLKLYKKYQKRINILNASLAKKKKGGKRRQKVKRQLTKAYRRLANTKKDYLHKKSKELVSCKEGTIVLGDINVQDIVNKNKKSKKHLVKSFYSAALSTFKNFVEYKTEKAGKNFMFVKENYTSKTCSCCGHINKKLKLSDRLYSCSNCNNSIDRDHNSAINMKLLCSSSIDGSNTIYACTYDKYCMYNEINTFAYIS